MPEATPPAARVSSKRRRLLTSLAKIITAVWVLACLGMYVRQDSLLFFPQSLSAARLKALTARGGFEQRFVISGGKRVQLLILHADQPGAACLFYFGGNAEESSMLLDEAERLGTRTLVVMIYPGYGQSEGEPSQVSLERAALDSYDALNGSCPHVDVLGRSLGSGVATYLSAQRPVRRTVLVSPYDSVVSVAGELYWWLPVRWLVRHPFDSHALAPKIKVPVLIIAGADDTLIPSWHSKRLQQAWGGPTRWLELAGATHSSVLDAGRTWEVIRAFLDEAGALRTGPAPG